MRFVKSLILLVSAVAYVHANDEDDGWEEADDHTVTVETDEEEAETDPDVDAPPAYEEDTTLAEQADANLSEQERKTRMGLCIGIAREQFLSSEEEMEKAVEMMKTIHNMESDQAREMIHINMIKNCYLNFKEEEDLPALTKSATEENKEVYQALVGKLVAPPAMPESEVRKQPTLLQRQWELIREVVEEERGRQTGPMGGAKIEVLGSNMSAFSKFMYFVSVFAAIFGGGYFLVRKLMELETAKVTKRKESKTAKKNRESSVETVNNKKDL
jgi:hypothetical protein